MRNKVFISPWMIIGISLVLITVVGFLGFVNYNRDKERMGSLLKEKGAALIRAFEAGTRTGMMGMMANMSGPANEAHLQILLEETADQPDIDYISIIDRSGVIIAHNNRSIIGNTFLKEKDFEAISPSQKTQWRIIKGSEKRIFEVYKTFSPVSNHIGHFHQSNRRLVKQILNQDNRPFIFIGMNITPFETAMKEDFSHNLVMAAIIFSLGLAGIISLFWAQNYTRSRKLLEDTQKLASDVVTSLPVGILVMDIDYNVIYSNRMMWRLLGVDAAHQKRINAKRILPDNMWILYDAVKSENHMVEKEICLVPKENKPVPVAVSATEIHSGNNEYIGFLFVIKDLTEIKELESRTQRIQKLATIGNMAAGIAHEIRNPLSSIKGYVTYFGSLFEDGSDNRKAADLMAEEVDRVNRVISELLEFARPADLKMKAVNVQDVVEHSLRVVSHDAETAGVQIIKEGDDIALDVFVDPDRMAQVLLNLYINSFQAMPEGGKLIVRIVQTTKGLIIEVEDTGKGIASEHLNHIFDPYFTTKNDGTGLGLAIAHKIIENHSGYIKAQNRRDCGTKISITLPLRKENQV